MKAKSVMLATLTLAGATISNASGILGSTASVMETPFCKKYTCRLVRRTKMPIDYQFPNSTIYDYTISKNYNKSLAITRLKGKVIVADLSTIEYSQASRAAIEETLKDFFTLTTGTPGNEAMWKVYNYCDGNYGFDGHSYLVNTSKSSIATCMFFDDTPGIWYSMLFPVKIH